MSCAVPRLAQTASTRTRARSWSCRTAALSRRCGRPRRKACSSTVSPAAPSASSGGQKQQDDGQEDLSGSFLLTKRLQTTELLAPFTRLFGTLVADCLKTAAAAAHSRLWARLFLLARGGAVLGGWLCPGHDLDGHLEHNKHRFVVCCAPRLRTVVHSSCCSQDQLTTCRPS